MIFFRILTVLILLVGPTEIKKTEPYGNWLGILTIKPVTYRIYLKHSEKSSQLFILNPKANEIPLDTFYFKNDSLYFTRADFFSTFEGKYQSASNTVHGYWTDDGHKKHPVTFKPVDPDTLTGLRPKTNNELTWMDPPQGKDGMKTCNTSGHKNSAPLLDSLSLSIMRERYPNIHSLLIAQDNCLFYEDYFYGWKPDNIWLIQSATKSFTSALAGIAIAKGEIKNLDESICRYLTGYKDKACNMQNRNITLRQLLTMTTGLDWNELEFDYYDERNTANLCGKVPDPFDCVLSRNKIDATGPQFSYNSMNHSMMNMVLKKSKSMKNEKELKQRLLDPLGISVVKAGNESFGVIGDIALTPRSMMKFGLLYLNDGKWNGKPLIPSQWVKESTASHVALGNGEGYGYFWWTKQFTMKGELVECYYAWGYGGQYIFVVPSMKLVVTMTASNWIMDEKKYAFEMMQKFILPAAMQ